MSAAGERKRPTRYRDAAAGRAQALRELEYAADAAPKATARLEAALDAALDAGVTQTEAAKVLGVTRQAVSKHARKRQA